MAIKKLTDNPRGNTCIIFNVHSKKKLIFVQKSDQKAMLIHTHNSQTCVIHVW